MASQYPRTMYKLSDGPQSKYWGRGKRYESKIVNSNDEFDELESKGFTDNFNDALFNPPVVEDEPVEDEPVEE